MEKVLCNAIEAMFSQVSTERNVMGFSEMQFGIAKLEEKGSILTSTQRRYISKFLELKTAASVAAFFGVRSDTVSESILRGARQMGFRNSTEMYCYALGVNKKNAADDLVVASSALEEMYQEQEGRCNLSGVVLTQENMVLDHIVPRSKGGMHSLDNVQWLAEQVNSAKGTMDEETFIRMCCRVAVHSRGYRKPKKTKDEKRV